MNKPPPYLLGAALLFWGSRAEVLWLGAIAGVAIEMANFTKARWEFSGKEFNRIWDVCTLIFVGVGVYLRFSEEVTNAAYQFFLWFPMIFLPMAIGQVYSTQDEVPYRAFSWFKRRRKPTPNEKGVNVAWAYFGVTVVCAGASNLRDLWFFIGISVLVVWAAWANRTFRFPATAWVVSMTAAVAFGFFWSAQLPNLQIWFEGHASELLARLARRDFDARESRTSMGRLGRMKQSSRVVMRVQAEEGPLPPRLRQAVYNVYRDEIWRSTMREFKEVGVEADTTSWTLSNETNRNHLVRVNARLSKSSAMLSLPPTPGQVLELPANRVETNVFRATRSENNPALASYLVTWGGSTRDELPPEAADRYMEDSEKEVIAPVARELKLFDLPDGELVKVIEEYFADFKYTTYQEAAQLGFHRTTPLERFLVETKAGHCEYFATATVLLLRHLGIPARYVTGYAIQERSGDSYIVRERHAHAWATAYVDGEWIEVDTTPADWEQEEYQDFPFYQGFKEWLSGLGFAFTEFRWLSTTGWIGTAAPWIIAVMAIYLGWRIFGKRLRRTGSGLREGDWPGLDSEVFVLERKLSSVGLGREAGETTAQWLTRAREHLPHLEPILRELLTLHYRYRFDPVGIQKRERAELKRIVQGVEIEPVSKRG